MINQGNISLPYLDNRRIPVVEGVNELDEDKKNDEIERYLTQIDKCGIQFMKDDHIRTRRCKKILCPKCGGFGKSNHKKAIKAIMKRIQSLDGKFIRYITFTIPISLRSHFETKDMIDRFLHIVQRIIKKEFGVLTHYKIKKKGNEPVYALEKPALATIELFSNKQSIYHPHINVLIFDSFSRGVNPTITKEKLLRIKTTFKKALKTLLNIPIEKISIHYDFCPKKNHSEVKKLICYVTKPLNFSLLDNIQENEELLRNIELLVVELKGFRYMRFWGKLANSEYQKMEVQLQTKGTFEHV